MISWSGLISSVGFGSGISLWPMARIMCRMRALGSSSSDTITDGLSASREDARRPP